MTRQYGYRGVNPVSMGAFVIVLAVAFMLPLSSGVALRNVAILIGCGWCIWQWRTVVGALQTDRQILQLFAGYFGFVLLLLVHTLLFADSISVSAAALIKEWGGGGAMLVFGVCIAIVAAQSGSPASGLVAAAIALLSHTVWMLLYQARPLLSGQAYALGKTPFAAYDYFSQIVSQLVIVMLVAVTIRVWSGKKVLPWNDRWLGIAVIVSLLGMVGVNARTGLVHVGAATLFLVGALLVGAGSSLGRMQKRVAASILAMTLAVASLSLILDARWARLADSVAAGIDIRNNRTWADETRYPLPMLPGGEQADHSAYLRSAFATVALQSLAKHPQGIGYGVDAFGRAVQKDHDAGAHIVSSHSSFLDFMIGVGVAGGLLLVVLVVVTCRLLTRRYFDRGDPASLLAAILLGSYFVRCFPEGHLSGWRLKLALFLCGLALGASLMERCRSEAIRSGQRR